MEELLRRTVGDRTAVVLATERIDGDVHPIRVDSALLSARQAAITQQPWTMLDQVHGIQSYESVAAEGPPGVAAKGDILVTCEPNVPLAIWAADCAPVVLFGAAGTTIAFHAGWRGLAAGVIDASMSEIRSRGDDVLVAVLGPVIHPCCYEFGQSDLRLVAEGVRVDPKLVSGKTRSGRLALDVPAAVRQGLDRYGVGVDVAAGCTGCDSRWYSHRVRRDIARHAVVTWTETQICDKI